MNLFFLLNIVRVLITKLRVTHQAESSLYMRAVRATLILIPLLGIQFVLLPYKPHDHWVLEIYLYLMEILMHYQVGVPGLRHLRAALSLPEVISSSPPPAGPLGVHDILLLQRGGESTAAEGSGSGDSQRLWAWASYTEHPGLCFLY